MKEICVVGGAGYVGLITGAGFAALGHRVTCVDVDSNKVGLLKQGRSPVYEAGLEPLLTRLQSQGTLEFTTEIDTPVSRASIVFIAVGTPSLVDGRADLSQVISVSEDLARAISRYTVVAVKSTVPVGATDVIGHVLGSHLQEGRDFDIASNPEFLREGHGLEDFFNPDRIVVGARSDRAFAELRQLYEPLVGRKVFVAPDFTLDDDKPVPYIETNLASAQMIKYAANAFLAARISMINEVAGLCELLGADVATVTHGLGLDPRIGPSYLRPGIGFGGPCLEKDLRSLITLAQEREYKPVVLQAVLERNQFQLTEVRRKLARAIGPVLYRKQIAVLGLAFKEGTNDVRNSISLRLIRSLLDQGSLVRGHDSLAMDEAKGLIPEAAYFADPYEAAQGADALIIVTSDPAYKALDYGKIAGSMAHRIMIDTPNLLDPDSMKKLGFHYESMGRSAR